MSAANYPIRTILQGRLVYGKLYRAHFITPAPETSEGGVWAGGEGGPQHSLTLPASDAGLRTAEQVGPRIPQAGSGQRATSRQKGSPSARAHTLPLGSHLLSEDRRKRGHSSRMDSSRTGYRVCEAKCKMKIQSSWFKNDKKVRMPGWLSD